MFNLSSVTKLNPGDKLELFPNTAKCVLLYVEDPVKKKSAGLPLVIWFVLEIICVPFNETCKLPVKTDILDESEPSCKSYNCVVL